MATLAQHEAKAMRRARDRADAFCAEITRQEELYAARSAMVRAMSEAKRARQERDAMETLVRTEFGRMHMDVAKHELERGFVRRFVERAVPALLGEDGDTEYFADMALAAMQGRMPPQMLPREVQEGFIRLMEQRSFGFHPRADRMDASIDDTVQIETRMFWDVREAFHYMIRIHPGVARRR